jgi:hypothetical protein
MSTIEHWVILLIHAQGGAASATGPTVAAAQEVAARQLKRFPKSYVEVTEPYRAVPSTHWPGVWNVSLPAAVENDLSPEVRALYRKES